MADCIPGPDANFQAWQSNFVVYANANLVALGLTAPDMAPVTAAQTGWATAFPAHSIEQMGASSHIVGGPMGEEVCATVMLSDAFSASPPQPTTANACKWRPTQS